MKNNKKILFCGVVLILTLISLVVIPTLVAFGITKPILFWKNVCNGNDWIGFWGGYIGAIISSAVAWGMWYFQRKEDMKKEKVQRIEDRKKMFCQ